uniref:Uncharacterized protein n=1 Tax=Hemiselmis andersenii TaxID=464988 RepID=A0A6U2EFG3_HEMAN|mmetsp:Transcript_27259/g.63250  ORF Transcript_27259/g.63250 Transcript_27259/m.63250 type:complete len:174 (-) Transcript_27259:181-702(-)
MDVSKGSMPEIHNKREGDMSDEELKQCVLDMETWLVANAGSAGSEFAGAAGASKELIDGLPASAPAALKGLLGVHDGKLPLLDFVGLACAEIVSEASAAKGSGKWQDDYVPIAKNPDGDLLVTCASGVHRWDSELGLGSAESASLSAHLEQYRNLMMQGKLEYVEDCGIMEVA